MVPYFGHTRHSIKAPHKPIKQGFKIWALGDHGYIYNWLWYSKAEGTEATKPTKTLAETQSLVLNLAKSLPQPRAYSLYNDNLFNNIPLAQALLELNIGVTGTIRKNASGFPEWLVQQDLLIEPCHGALLGLKLLKGSSASYGKIIL